LFEEAQGREDPTLTFDNDVVQVGEEIKTELQEMERPLAVVRRVGPRMERTEEKMEDFARTLGPPGLG